jgi:hypothetical protein
MKIELGDGEEDLTPNEAHVAANDEILIAGGLLSAAGFPKKKRRQPAEIPDCLSPLQSSRLPE